MESGCPPVHAVCLPGRLMVKTRAENNAMAYGAASTDVGWLGAQIPWPLRERVLSASE